MDVFWAMGSVSRLLLSRLQVEMGFALLLLLGSDIIVLYRRLDGWMDGQWVAIEERLLGEQKVGRPFAFFLPRDKMDLMVGVQDSGI